MKYHIGIQDFEDLRNDGYVYVDKTAIIHQLASMGKYYFLSRPRRFGKTLLLSAMKAYFEGKKELFKGLAIERLEQDWKQYPVLHVNFVSGTFDTLQNLESKLNTILAKWEKIYGSSEEEETLESRFEGIIQRAYEKTGLKVVILIDEYDKPVLSAIGDEEMQEKLRRLLRSFYSVLKAQDQYIRFAFLTGVTKFSHLSIFSDLNNLKDITIDERYADICGITEKELHAYFEDSIKELADKREMTYEEACAKLEEMYDGYHFAPDSVGMYNPFSLLNTLDKKRFDKYWFMTGTPSFLVRMLREEDFNLDNLQLEPVPASSLSEAVSMKASPVALLYQSGYMTIKSYDESSDQYQLGFPNREVGEGFLQSLLPLYTNGNQTESTKFIQRFINEVRDGLPDDFLSDLKTFLDDSDYRIAGKFEVYFQSTMAMIFRLMGFQTQVERATSQGRIDMVIQTNKHIYVMELKVDASAEEALAQIDSKGYLLPFAADNRKLYKIGVSFSSEKRSIQEWKCVEVS